MKSKKTKRLEELEKNLYDAFMNLAEKQVKEAVAKRIEEEKQKEAIKKSVERHKQMEESDNDMIKGLTKEIKEEKDKNKDK